MTISKKEITSLIEKSYSKVLRRIFTAYSFQSHVSLDLKPDDLNKFEILLSTCVRLHIREALEQEKILNILEEKRLEKFLELVNWRLLAKKYCKSIDKKKNEDPIDLDELYKLYEKHYRIEFNDYDFAKVRSDLFYKYPPQKIFIKEILTSTDEEDIYNSKNKKAKLAPDWYEASCKELGLIGVFETKKEAKDCFELYKKNKPDLNNLEIKPVRCMPPGRYFIGDLGLILDDYENQSKYPNGRDVYQLEDGTLFANFKTWGGDGIFEDQVGWQYGVDTGGIGAIPIRSLPKELRNIKSGQGQRVRIFKHPVICSYGFPIEGCIKIGNDYIFTSVKDVSEEMKKSLFLEGYQRDVILDRRKSEDGNPNPNSFYGYKVDGPYLDTIKNQIDQIKGQNIQSNTQSKGTEIDTSILDCYNLDNFKLPDFRITLKKDILIKDLNLSVRAFNILMRSGFEYINDLSGLTYFDFLEMRNLGSKATNEIIVRLHEKGYISKELILEIPVLEEPIREIWTSGDKVIHNLYGPGRLIGSNPSFIVVRFEQLQQAKKVYQIDPYTPHEINQIISKKIYPYNFLKEQSSIKVVRKISEEKYQEYISRGSNSFDNSSEIETIYEIFEQEWKDLFEDIPSEILYANAQKCIGSLIELFKRYKTGMEIFDDQGNSLNEKFFIKLIDNTVTVLHESFATKPKLVWINKYGETPPANQSIEVLGFSKEIYNQLKRLSVSSLSKLALMGYDDFHNYMLIGYGQIVDKFKELGFLMKLNEGDQRLDEFCPEYQWANIKRLKELGYEIKGQDYLSGALTRFFDQSKKVSESSQANKL